MNTISFTPTAFIHQNAGTRSLGYFAKDSYEEIGKYFDDDWQSIPDDNLDILQKIYDTREAVVDAMFDYMRDYEVGCKVADVWYSYDDIKFLFKEKEEEDEEVVNEIDRHIKKKAEFGFNYNGGNIEL